MMTKGCIRKIKPQRRHVRGVLNDWIENWKLGHHDYCDDHTFIITYNDGNIKRIHLQDYAGEKIRRTGIKNIEVIEPCGHYDFTGEIHG